ncbi:MAG: tape measure protein, partial [Gemmiger sp.]
MAYDGSISFDTSVDTSGFSDGTGDINKQFDTIRKGAESAAQGLEQVPDKLDETTSSASRLSDIVKGGGVFKLIEKGVNAVVASLDSAIDRYDTMNRFPMMLQQMGYGADSAQAAVQRLSEGIQGIPTTLDSVVSTAQRLTVLTDNLDGAVDTTLALNNAFLASGAGSDGAARGLEQYV